MDAEKLAATMAEMKVDTYAKGAACRELVGPHGPTWLETSLTKDGRVTWALEERRIAVADVAAALLGPDTTPLRERLCTPVSVAEAGRLAATSH